MPALLRCLFAFCLTLCCVAGLARADELRIEALDGGVVDLRGLTQIVAQQHRVAVVAEGASSNVNLSSLASIAARPGDPASTFAARTGGALALHGARTTFAGPVTLELAPTGTVTLGVLELGNSSLLTGSGALSGALSNGGEVRPGGSGAAGTLNINGAYTQTAQGQLSIELGGDTAGGGYDRLTSTATATLDGALAVSLINNYTPNAGRRFDILTASSRSDQFSTASGLDLGNGARLDVEYGASNATLVAIGSGLPDNEGPEISDVRFEGVALTDGFSIPQSGTITVTADDPSGIDRVEFLLDGVRFATDTRGINPASALLSILNLADGSYLLTAIAYDTANNATSLSYTVLIGASVADVPDLTVTAIQVPAAHLPGQSANVSWTVKNKGGMTATGPWADQVYLSPDAIFGNGNDTLLTSASFPAGSSLAPGTAYDRASNITLPTTPGTYWLIVVTDADHQVAEEGGETNNVRIAETPLVVANELPDLIVTQVVPPQNGVLSGSPTEVTFTVKNVGTTATTVSWKDLIIVSPDTALIDPPPFLWNEESVGEFDNPQFLQPGESYQQTVAITLPEDEIGAFHIAVYADGSPNGVQGSVFQVPELDESNNVTFSDAFTVALAPQPDLIVTDIEAAPKPVFSGQELTVTWTARNQGQGPTDSGAWTDAVYLSANNNPAIDTTQDIWLGTQERTGAVLQPGQSDTTLSLKQRLPANLQGNFYVKVVADLNNQITELGFEDNNVGVSAQPLQVVLSVPVDLEATAIGGPPTGIPGHEIDVTWSAENVGAEPEFSLAWEDAVYLSSDQTLDNADVRLGRFAVTTGTTPGGLPTLPPYALTRSVRLPNGTVAGTYYLIVKLDWKDEVFELAAGEANNVRASTTPITIQQIPTDLTVEVNFDAGHQLPSAAAAGQSLPLSWRVTNTGQAATPVSAWQDQVYLSSDATLDSSDVGLVGVTRNGELAPGTSYTVTRNVSMPTVALGSYFLLFKTDDTDAVYEQAPGEDNNVASSPLTVADHAADLTPTQCVAPDRVVSGSGLFVEWTVANGGTLATNVNSWVDAVYLSTDQSLDEGDTVLGSQTITQSEALAPGESYTQSASFTVPLQLNGLFYLIQRTDRDNQVLEANENNNLCIRPVLINLDENVVSNLTVGSVSAPTTAIVGQPVSVSWTVHNIGSGPTNVSSWNDGVYLSRDQFFDPDQDLFIGSAVRNQPLNGGGSYTATADFQVPSGVEGLRYVLVMTDLNNQVVETSETDNVGGLNAIQVVAPPPSDLAVGDITLPSASILGQEASFSWQVTNAGQQPIQGGWSDSVYLSSDAQWDINDKRLGTFNRPAGPLNPGQSALVNGAAAIPAVLPGVYHAIIRTDVFNQIPETNENNNLGVSVGTFEVSAIPLALGVPFEGTLSNGQEQYFQFDVAAGETVRLTLDHTSPTAWTELYVRYGAVPTPGQFDFLYDAPAQPDQEIIIPTTQAGRYYVLAKATGGVTEPAVSFSLMATVIPFGITSVEPSVVGTGKVTLRLKGSRWDSGTTFRIRNTSAGQEIAAIKNTIESAAEARAKFDLSGAALGGYDVIVVSAANATAVLPSALTIESASELRASYDISERAAIRKGTSGSHSITVTNNGNVNIPYLEVFVASWRDDSIIISAPSVTEPACNSPDGLRSYKFLYQDIAPGEQVNLPVVIKVENTYGYSELPVFVEARPYSHDAYRDGPIMNKAKQFLASVITNPETDPEVVKLFQNSDFLDAVKNNFDLYGLEVPPEEPLSRLSELQVFSSQSVSPSSATNDSITVACKAGCDYLAALCLPICIRMANPALGVLCTASCYLEKNRCNHCCGNPCSSICLSAYISDSCEQPPPPPPPPACATSCFKRCVDWENQTVIVDGKEIIVGVVCAQTVTICTPPADCDDTPNASDPNLKSGVVGFGEQHLVSQGEQFQYRIDFENLASATAPAAEVRISDAISPLLKLGSLRLSDIHFGNTTIDVPDGRTSFQTTVDLTASAGVLVDVTAGVNAATNEAFWLLRSIDPATGEPPTDGATGFLPPEDGTGRGQGRVEFTIEPKSTAPVGSVIRNQASITFDFEEPIVTNEWINTLGEATSGDLVITADLPAARLNQAYSGRLNVSGGTPPYTFTLVDGVGLPTGLSLNADGTITGTPTQSGTYYLSVLVVDTANHNSAYQTTLSVIGEPPIANAGQDQTITLGGVVTLDGSASSDPDHGPQPLSYTWEFAAVPSGSALTNASLTNANTAQPGFTPDVVGEYRLRLTVSDGDVSSTPDVVVVTVIAANPVYLDVPSNHWAYQAIQALAANGVMTGCSTEKFCPDEVVTNAPLALVLERKLRGGDYTPAAASGNRFTDVPATHWAAAWIEQLAGDGIAYSCDSSRYCPNDAVTNAKLAILLGRLIHGAAYTPPPAQGNRFSDVTSATFAAAWIEQLANDEITTGCGDGKFCPTAVVTRAQLAVLLNRITSITPPTGTASTTQGYLPDSARASATQNIEVSAGTSGLATPVRRLNIADLPPALRRLLEAAQATIADVYASADGDLIVFASDSDELTPYDSNGVSDVFLYELRTQTLRRISVSSAGVQGDGPSYNPRMDSLGKIIVFVSEASNLVADDRNGVADLFLHRSESGRTERLSVGLGGEPANGPSYSPRIDNAGAVVAFVSEASNLITDDRNDVADIFLYDLAHKVTERVSHDEWGAPITTAAAHPALDGTGVQILYDRTNADGWRQIYGHANGFAPAEILSAARDEQGQSLDNHHPSLSADGRYLAYIEESHDLAGSASSCQVIVRERATAREARLSCPELLAILPDPTPVFDANGRMLQWFQEPLSVNPAMDGVPTLPATTVTLPNPLW